MEHIVGKKSNSALQKSIAKYGLDKFYFYVYEYYEDNKTVNNITLTNLETKYIKNFDFNSLYNFKRTATSMLGYRHTEEALLKMVAHYKNKKNHPMYGKTHTKEAKKLISKPGAANPMFGKKHSEKSKLLMSIKKNKSPLGVGLYDSNFNLLEKFNNNVLIRIFYTEFENLIFLYHKQKLSLYFGLGFFFFTLLYLYYGYIVFLGFDISYFSGQTIAIGFDNIALLSVVPVKFYANADTDKSQILKENRSKSGIYQ